MVIKVMSLTNKQIVKEGKRKIIYQGPNNDQVISYYKDTNPLILNSGILRNLMTEQLFTLLNKCSISTQFIRRMNLREQEIYNTSVFPFQVRITNIITQPLHTLLDIAPGQILKRPVIDFVVERNNVVHVIDQSYLSMFDWCMTEYLDTIKQTSLRINDALQAFFFQFYAHISHCYLQFGLFEPDFTLDKTLNGVMLIDELTPFENFGLWSRKTDSMIEPTFANIQALTSYMNLSDNHCQDAGNDQSILIKE